MQTRNIERNFLCHYFYEFADDNIRNEIEKWHHISLLNFSNFLTFNWSTNKNCSKLFYKSNLQAAEYSNFTNGAVLFAYKCTCYEHHLRWRNLNYFSHKIAPLIRWNVELNKNEIDFTSSIVVELISLIFLSLSRASKALSDH